MSALEVRQNLDITKQEAVTECHRTVARAALGTSCAPLPWFLWLLHAAPLASQAASLSWKHQVTQPPFCFLQQLHN